MTMDNNSLDRFGEFIVHNLRDQAIGYYDALTEGKWNAPSDLELQSELDKLTDEQKLLVRKCVIGSIDVAFHNFLFKLQELSDFENDIQIIVNGKNITELSDGLQGEAYSDKGWYARFSKYGENK